jgi:putative acetyltransferase
MKGVKIREEISTDFQSVWELNAAAFETEVEANLVNILRESGISYISLVAEQNEKIIGHILFTPVTLEGDDSGIRLAGLAPMAVIPNLQRQGIGSMLVAEGIKHCKSAGFDAIVVLGHPEYYPRFGFVPSVNYNIISEYDVPDEAFMLLELSRGCLKGKQGKIKYHKAFSDA